MIPSDVDVPHYLKKRKRRTTEILEGAITFRGFEKSFFFKNCFKRIILYISTHRHTEVVLIKKVKLYDYHLFFI